MILLREKCWGSKSENLSLKYLSRKAGFNIISHIIACRRVNSVVSVR